MKKLSDQSGFSAIEVILVLVVLALVGGTGYYVYAAHDKTLKLYNAASEDSSRPVISSKKSSTAKPATTTTTKTSTSTTQSSTADTQKLQAASAAASPNDTKSANDMTAADSALTSN